MGIASRMIELIKEKYHDYLYIEVMPEEKKKAAFYQKCGFTLMDDGAALQICNFADKR